MRNYIYFFLVVGNVRHVDSVLRWVDPFEFYIGFM